MVEGFKLTEVDGIDKERIIRMLRPLDLLAQAALLRQEVTRLVMMRSRPIVNADVVCCPLRVVLTISVTTFLADAHLSTLRVLLWMACLGPRCCLNFERLDVRPC